MPEVVTPTTEYDQLTHKLKTEREVGIAYQKRRHDQWDDNYTLYRDFVHINRLTQRQAVNVPLMKETIKTLLAAIDDPPDIYFKNLDNDVEAEYVLNEYWLYEYTRVDMEGLDIQDKKNVLLYGRSFMKLNFFESKFAPEVLDPYDIVVDSKMKPGNLDSARFLTHQNIYKPLQDIMNNDKYTTKGKKMLSQLMFSKQGLVLGGENQKALEQKIERLESLGANEQRKIEDILAGSDIIVSLTEHYTMQWNKKTKKFEKYVIVVAQDNIILYEETLKKTLGVDFWPFVTWASDLDVSDVWTDGEADIVRVINKVLNAWISQGTENRTLRNWGMRYYDTTKGFNPQSFTPEPWGWYPIPGNPNEIVKDMEIQSMSDALPEMDFLIRLIEKATATPATEKGVAEKKQITLGEVELIVGKATERVKGMAKFYRRARRELADKWYKIVEANVAPSQTMKLFKTSFKGNIFEREVSRRDWKSKAGYKVQVTSSSEQEEEKAIGIQRLLAIKAQFPDNPVLQKTLEKRLLEIADLTPEEIKEIMAFEEQKTQQALAPPPLPAPAATPPPEAVALRGKVEGLKQLATETIA